MASGKTISSITAASVRASTDEFEIENGSSKSRSVTRELGITVLESPLITITSTNRDIFTTPIELVAAPSNALHGLIPTHLCMRLVFGTTVFDYGAAGIYTIYSTDNTDSQIIIPQADINSASSITKVYPLLLAEDMILQDSIEIYAAAAPTQGDSTVYLRLLYSLQDFNT